LATNDLSRSSIKAVKAKATKGESLIKEANTSAVKKCAFDHDDGISF
jgi:hypothetical protein